MASLFHFFNHVVGRFIYGTFFNSIIPILAIASYVLFYLWYSSNKQRIIVSGMLIMCLGVILDSILQLYGFIDFNQSRYQLFSLPIWLYGLWFCMPILYQSVFSAFRISNFLLSFLIALMVPSSYVFGRSIGLATMPSILSFYLFFFICVVFFMVSYYFFIEQTRE